MNLIKQLGGYERAKAFLNAASYTMDELIMMQRSGVRPQHVEKALLEYRRQHNIFEKGDQVCYIGEIQKNPFWDLNSIFTIKEIWDGEIDLITSDDDLGCFPVRPHQIGHATDAEIEAGKRLEVS